MPKQLVWVEVDGDRPIRILRNHLEVWKLPLEQVRQWPKSEAVKNIRDQVFDRCKGECEHCGKRVTKLTGELHEMIHKSLGGEVSLDNCRFLCHGCHQGRKDSEHGERRWQS